MFREFHFAVVWVGKLLLWTTQGTCFLEVECRLHWQCKTSRWAKFCNPEVVSLLYFGTTWCLHYFGLLSCSCSLHKDGYFFGFAVVPITVTSLVVVQLLKNEHLKTRNRKLSIVCVALMAASWILCLSLLIAESDAITILFGILNLLQGALVIPYIVLESLAKLTKAPRGNLKRSSSVYSWLLEHSLHKVGWKMCQHYIGVVLILHYCVKSFDVRIALERMNIY